MDLHRTLAAPATTAAVKEDDVCTCSICFSAFSASEEDGVPRLLKCGHSFCTACITCLLGSTTPSTSTSAEAEQATCALRCPKCRTVTRVLLVDGEAAAAGVKGLPRNFDLIDLLSSSPDPEAPTANKSGPRPQTAVVRWLRPRGGGGEVLRGVRRCPPVRVVRHTQLHALLLNRSHVRVASADAPEPRAVCEHHQAKKVEMWCESDGVAVCMVCLVVGPHKGHDAVTIEEAEQQMRESARVELALAMGEVDTAVEREATREAGEEESAREARAAIKQHFDRMREAVAQRERTLGAEVDKWERTRIKKAAKLAEIQTRLAAAGKALQQQLQRYVFGRSATADDWAAACKAARTAARGSQAGSSSISFASKDTWTHPVASSGRLKRCATGAAGAGGVTCMRDYTAMTAAQHTLRCGIPLGVAVAATPGHIVVADYSSRLVHVLRAADGSLVRTLATTKASGVKLEMPGAWRWTTPRATSS